MLRKTSLLAAAALFVGLGLGSRAHAGLLQVMISDNKGNSLTVVDNGAGDDNPLANVINIREGPLTANFPGLGSGSDILASSNQAAADPFSRLALNTQLLRSSATLGMITYTIKASQTDFVKPPADDKLVSSSYQGTFFNAKAQNQTQFQGWADGSNTLYGMTGVSPGLHGPFNSTTFPALNTYGSELGPVGFMDVNPYSLTVQQVAKTLKNSETRSVGVITVTAGQIIPEPSSVALIGLGLPALVLLARRARRSA